MDWQDVKKQLEEMQLNIWQNNQLKQILCEGDALKLLMQKNTLKF